MRAWIGAWVMTAAANAGPVVETQVVTFKPAPPPALAPVQRGSCWTESIAVDRAGVWRCKVGNAISDPCFEGASPGAVVCRANPALGEPGFTLQLDAPLPKSTVKHGPPQPWLLLLEDGTACQATTGTLPPVDGDPARWACPPEKPGAEPRYLSGLQPGKVWRAERFTLVPSKQSATGYARGGAQPVAIRTLWE